MSSLQAAYTLLDRFIAQHMAYHGTPSLALAVTDRDHLLHLATYGYADVATHTPLTPDHLFQIGSIGKSFTALAVLQQHAQGRIDLLAPVTAYLPWFAVRSAYPPITVHPLLSHTAGISSGSHFTPSSRYEVAALRDTDTTWVPGTQFCYSNAGYYALGFLLEDVLQRSYADIIQADILDPLGMTASVPAITNVVRQRLTTGYKYGRLYDDRPTHRNHPLVPAPWVEYTTAAGSIAATPADMAAYVRMLLNHGQGPNGPVVNEASFDLLTQPIIDTGDGSEWYGYGVIITQRNGHRCITHGGTTLAYMSDFVADLDAGLGVVALADGPGWTNVVVDFALALLLAASQDRELPPLPPVPNRTRIADAGAYTGTYTAGDYTITIVARDDQLLLEHNGVEIVLEQRGEALFYADHSDWALFFLSFGRQDGDVVEMFHGGAWYTNDRYRGPTTFSYPDEWNAYVGHYRAYNPWVSNFRVVLRKGALCLLLPNDSGDPLEPLEDGSFRIFGPHSPERVRFDMIVDGQALRARVAGGDYYRVITP